MSMKVAQATKSTEGIISMTDVFLPLPLFTPIPLVRGGGEGWGQPLRLCALPRCRTRTWRHGFDASCYTSTIAVADATLTKRSEPPKPLLKEVSALLPL